MVVTAPGAAAAPAASEALESAEKVMAALDKAFKAYRFYPAHHDACRSSLVIAKSTMDAFLNAHSVLKLHVETHRFLMNGEAVYTVSSPEGMSALLYRDGILWIEFRKGILLEEIEGFFSILLKYRHLEEESDGDVVTALWEHNFRHLRYEAKEVFWEKDPLSGFSLPHLSGNDRQAATEEPAEEATGETGEAERDPEAAETGAAVAAPPGDGKADLWTLTPQEEQILQEMVFEQENLESMDASIEVLVLILRDKSVTGSRKHEDIAVILEFLAATLHDTFQQEAFSTGLKLLKRLDEVRTVYKETAPRSVRLIDKFFDDISSPPFLDTLAGLWPKLEGLESRRIAPFQEVLLLLQPRAIRSFLPMLSETASGKIRGMLLEIVVALARRDITPLSDLAGPSDEETALLILRVLDRLGGQTAWDLMFKLVRHPSKRVRKEAVLLLTRNDPSAIQRLFPLLEDEDEGTRRMLFSIMAKRRDRATERLLLDYLEQGRFNRSDPQHLVTCYQTLGRCGSDLSTPFLEQVLLGRSFKSIAGLDRLTERKAAALALFSLETDAAGAILKKATRSRTPGIRLALRRAKERRNDR